MMKPKNYWACAAMFLCLSGCTQPSSPSAPLGEPKADVLAQRITTLEGKLDAVEKKAARSVSDIFELKNRYQAAEIDPSDPKFARVDIGVGSFAVSVTDVSPFTDGVKVKVNLGNLSSAAVSGVTLHVTYGPRIRASDDYATWYSQLKNKDTTILTTLQPGSWNPVSVTLPGIDPKGFGYVSISMEATTILLRKQ